MAAILRALAALVITVFAVTACGSSGDGSPPFFGQDSGADASGEVPDPVECDLGATVIKEKIQDATPHPEDGGPTDSCSCSSGTKKSYKQPCLIIVFAGPGEELTTMDEAKAEGDSDTKYRLVPELGDKAWLEHKYDTKIHWQAKHVIVQLSSDTLNETDAIAIAKSVNDDLTKIGA